MRSKLALLTLALDGRFDPNHHGILIRLHLNLIGEYDTQISILDEHISQAVNEFADTVALLTTIPGISTTTAQQIIAEIGINMSQFPTPAHLTSWAGLAPGSNESAGKAKPVKCRPGNRWLKGSLGIAALAATRTNNTYFKSRHRRIQARQGKAKALVATSRIMLVAIWHVLSNHQPYTDPGADYFTTLHPQRDINHAIHRLTTLGYHVTLTPITTKEEPPVAKVFS